MIRSLFCIRSMVLCGGTRVLLELVTRLTAAGQGVDVFVYDGSTASDWFPTDIPIVTAETIEQAVESQSYDFIYFSEASLIPVAMPNMKAGIPVFICQGDESYLRGQTLSEASQVSSSFASIVNLPIAVIAISQPIQSGLRERLNKESCYVPVGIDSSFFQERSRASLTAPRKRILMVGSYLLPLKGMHHGFAAVEKLSHDVDVELVLLTQETRKRRLFEQYHFPVEFHVRPKLEQIAAIYRTAHIYCCTSWYEGLGLPAIEAFAAGTPVISTRNQGVGDYGIDGENILLAEQNADDLCEKMKLLLQDTDLYHRLQNSALATARRYSWDIAIDAFLDAQRKMKRDYKLNAAAFLQTNMDKIIDLMKKENVFIPADELRCYQRARASLGRVCIDLRTKRLSIADGITIIETVQEELKPFLQDQVGYSLYNFCRLVVALKDDERFFEYLELWS